MVELLIISILFLPSVLSPWPHSSLVSPQIRQAEWAGGARVPSAEQGAERGLRHAGVQLLLLLEAAHTVNRPRRAALIGHAYGSPSVIHSKCNQFVHLNAKLHEKHVKLKLSSRALSPFPRHWVWRSHGVRATHKKSLSTVIIMLRLGFFSPLVYISGERSMKMFISERRLSSLLCDACEGVFNSHPCPEIKMCDFQRTDRSALYLSAEQLLCEPTHR